MTTESPIILGITPEAVAALAKEFPPEQVRLLAAKPDGFRAKVLDWTHITRRLDEVFNGGWSFEVVAINWLQSAVLVQGRLSVSVVQTVLGADHLVGIMRDGIGSSGYTNNPADDAKAAATDALKRAAVLFGVGVQLYDRGSPEQPVALPQPPPGETPALPFQINQVCTLLEQQLGLQRQDWMARLQVSNLVAFPLTLAQQILSGAHPLVVEACRARGITPPQLGLRPSST